MTNIDADPSDQDASNRNNALHNNGENVLVLADSINRDADEYCATQLSTSTETTPHLLVVSLDNPPDNRFNSVVGPEFIPPSNVGIICCDETRGTGACQTAHGPEIGLGPWITTVSSPGDLTGLGIRIQRALSVWGEDTEVLQFCFHSLTVLIQYVGDRAAFRFCHLVTRHLHTVGANSYFHLDPKVVDKKTISIFSSLFDRVEQYG
jgi:hypothetical protein